MQTTQTAPEQTTSHGSGNRGLRIVLGLIGVFITVFGLNVALGGIETLGWEGRSDFVAVTDQSDFDIQDNHTRFIAGVWTGPGLVFLAATRWLDQLRTTLVVLSGLIFVGGLARLSSGSLSLLLSGDIVGSFLAELILAPLLAWWLIRSAPRPETP